MPDVFAGSYTHSLDGKGRATVPVGFREQLASGFTLALNSSIDALAIYPPAKWEEVNVRLSKVRDTDDDGMDYMRLIMSNAQPESLMDAQGRILLVANLRDFVGIVREITFIGLRDHIEVWDSAAYEEKARRTRENFAALRKHVNESY